MRSHDTVSKFAYISIFTYVSKCVHVNGAVEPAQIFNLFRASALCIKHRDLGQDTGRIIGGNGLTE